MCGICGIIKKEEVTDTDTRRVAAMNEALVHRGPNSASFFAAPYVSLAMRRLSIIDIAGGQQPLFNEDKTVALIINGEIYNFMELRQELEARGCRFRTRSDCETVVHAYQEYGDAFVNKLRGMFAFCLYDANKNMVILGRDRLGEKPLYLYETDTAIMFSSEMKSLLTALPKEAKVVNDDALYAYFFYQYIPEPLTVFRGVRKLPPATLLTINLTDLSCTERPYWSLRDIPPSAAEPVHAVQNALEEIGTIVIRSDVPVGVSLSGGIDSSVIAILAARHAPKQLHAFSVGYPGYPENDERRHAQALAEKLNMQFHDIEVTHDEFLNDFDRVVCDMDDPIADIAAYGYWRVARAARAAGVPVLLAGFGGDELFWGYPWAVQAVRHNTLKKSLLGKIMLWGSLLAENKRYTLYHPIRALAYAAQKSFGAGFLWYDRTPGFRFTEAHQQTMFTGQFLNGIDRQLPYRFFVHNTFARPDVDATALLDEIWMLSNCIPLGDRLTMAHSVEMRLPLLDYRLTETVLAARASGATDRFLAPKQWLTDAVRNILPPEIIQRKKRGFTPPTGTWIAHVVEKNRERILDGYLVRNNILNKAFLEQMLGNIKVHRDFLYKTVVLETWLAHYL
ncbi:MAG: asparagine synthase (glutamine-hydrolyzing) [Patescibacteria group bacterium]